MMKIITHITLASVATLALMGCGDSYNDNKDKEALIGMPTF